MLGYSHPMYETSRVFRALMQAEGAEFDLVRQAIDDVLNQFYVRTATWGLDRWETELGLPPDPSLTDDERRDRIISHLRGFGTCTIAVTKSVAESYDKGEIDVSEDFAGYTVTIQFVDTLGVPTNIDDLKKALRAVIPAHLEIMYEYRYLTYDMLKDYGFTYDQLRAFNLTLTYDQLKTWKPA